MKPTIAIPAFWLIGLGSITPAQSETRIVIDPDCQRSIEGISELKRETYFGLCDPGTDFDRRCHSLERYEFLVKENGVTFGRALGVVNGLERWDKALREDPEHPGFADLAYLEQKLAARQMVPGLGFQSDMGGRLEVAAHESQKAFPAFMGEYTTKAAARESKTQVLPKNIEAAADLTAATLRYRFTDFNRPAYYELINEPHWSFWQDPHLAEWHLATWRKVHEQAPGVQVGGPCLCVPYFYAQQYKSFNSLKSFIDQTHCALDFYSFHVYDYLQPKAGDFGGRITSGLPLESVLDLVQNYTVNAYGKEISVVVSEHGGYGGDELVEQLAREKFPGEGFAWEMKKRSIDDFNMVSSAIANTLVFMDHPQTLRKAVPFILLESMGWNPKYYATLYSPLGYTNKNEWVPSQKILFYRLFRDLKGHRVTSFCPDPDIQTRAFAFGKTVFVVLNNLSRQPKSVSLDLPQPQSALLRRLGRNADFTPYLTETKLARVDPLVLQPRETLLLKAEYDHPLSATHTVNESAYYGDQIAVAMTGKSAHFTVRIPALSAPAKPIKTDSSSNPAGDRTLSNRGLIRYATLRVGVCRPASAGWDVQVLLNGHALSVPLEECAERLVEKEYASCKLIPLEPGWLKATNSIEVSFPDGHAGAIGSVVIRAATVESP